jgi:UDP-N-acetylglucosamine 2-epimerase (non-hydrolysing)
MARLKVVTIVGTRPEIIKLSRVLAELRTHTDHLLVHTGQNYDYELNEIFFNELEIDKPDRFLAAAAATAAETIGNVIAKADALLADEQPDAVLLLGDTNSCLSVIPAKRRRIPVFHMEAGNRCFDDRVPEEINRRIIDHISDINLPYTEHARRHLLAEGLPPERVIRTGSPMGEVLEHYREKIDASEVLTRLGLEPQGYCVASAHREENVDDPQRLAALVDSLNSIAERTAAPVVVSTHPRTRKRLEASSGLPKPADGLRFLPPLGFPDWVRLQRESLCTISDSGTLTEESAILGFPAVMLREAHERPEGMDRGTVIMAGLGRDRVLQAFELAVAHAVDGRRAFLLPPDYETESVSKKVVRLIVSYVDYVRRTVWFE